MMNMVINFLAMVSLSFILLGVGLVLSMKMNLDREKISPFECGFTPKFSARLPFSIRFFMVALIFLIFDVELILIFPIIPAISFSCSGGLNFYLFMIILILAAGLFHEIYQGSLSWAN